MGAVFALFGAFYFWTPKIIGKTFNENLGRIHFWTLFVGVNLTFFPQHFLGLGGMPRRIPDYPDAFAAWNAISSFGSLVSVVATALFGYIIYDILVNGKPVDANPWAVPAFFQSTPEFWMESHTASSLEWALESPTPFHSFNMLPVQAQIINVFVIYLIVFSYCYTDTDFSLLEFMTTSSVSSSSVIFVSKMSTSSKISKSSDSSSTKNENQNGSSTKNETSKSLPEDSYPIPFTSLMKKVSYIQRMYKDVSGGVYMLVSPSGRRYIGSSVDLSRRMEEYQNILKGFRKPKTSAERKLSQCSDVNVVFLCFVLPVIYLVEEQLAMFLFYPNINTYLVAFPNFSHTHVQHGTSAVDIAKQYRDYFPKESYEYLTFQSLIDQIE